jgi:hypothetical protein
MNAHLSNMIKKQSEAIRPYGYAIFDVFIGS